MPEIGPVRRAESERTFLHAVLRYFAARRALLPFATTTGYVAALSLAADSARGAGDWLLSLLSMSCAYVAAGPTLPGNGLRNDGSRQVGILAYALWSAALVLASSVSTRTTPWIDFCGGSGALLASVMAAVALQATRGTQGIAVSLPRTAGAPRAILVGLFALFGSALLASALALRDSESAPAEVTAHDAHTLAAAGALVILIAAAWMTLRETRLIVGVSDRVTTALGTIVASSVVALGALAIGDVGADRVLRLAVASSSVLVTVACTSGDPETLARLARRGIALLLFGGPVILLGGLAAQGPGRAVPVLLVTGLVTLAIGSVLPRLEEPLRPAEGRLLDVVSRATLALVRAEPETSMRDALAALRSLSSTMPESPELWSLSPPRVMTVDGAGYPSSRDATLPPLLLDIAKDEPEATLRTELLEALVVRRADLRPLARWMDERGALSLTLITREGELEGAIVLPRGPRREPMALEEVRAVKRLADAFSGASAAEAALLRSLARETEASLRADRAEARLMDRHRAADAFAERTFLATSRLAESAPGAPYSPAGRMAFASIERRLIAALPLVVRSTLGSDVVPYLAAAHLSTRRGRGPFVVVSGASTHEQDLARWEDPSRSPLALADGGLLVLQDGQRLAPPIQRLVASGMAHQRAPWDLSRPLDLLVAITVCGGLEELTVALDAALSVRLDDALSEAIVWPCLRERGEDLRSLVLSGLAREGVRARGSPLGIDDRAYARLAEYSFPGEEAELATLIQRLAAAANDGVVRLADVEQLGLAAEEFPPARVPRLSERISP